MAKPPDFFPFTNSFAGAIIGLQTLWLRIPDANFFGFDGGYTISRIRCSYQESSRYLTDTNGAIRTIAFVGLAITIGSPPPQPLGSISTRQSTFEIVWSEISNRFIFANGTYGLGHGVIDCEAQRSIPADQSAACWFGWELRLANGNIFDDGTLRLAVTGGVVRLRPEGTLAGTSGPPDLIP